MPFAFYFEMTLWILIIAVLTSVVEVLVERLTASRKPTRQFHGHLIIDPTEISAETTVNTESAK